MKNKVSHALVVLGIIMILVTAPFSFLGCTQVQDQEKSYVLTTKEKEIVDFVYNHRYVWENKNGKSASNIRYKEKNGYSFLLVTYPQGNQKFLDEYFGQSSPIGLEKKYTLNMAEGKVYEAHLDEYGSKDIGAVYGLVGYDTSWSETEKKNAISKAVAG